MLNLFAGVAGFVVNGIVAIKNIEALPNVVGEATTVTGEVIEKVTEKPEERPKEKEIGAPS
jgi:hypothetical protein